MFPNISPEKDSKNEKFEKFRGNKLSRMKGFEIFRGINFRRKGQKNAKPRKFLAAKVSDLKVQPLQLFYIN